MTALRNMARVTLIDKLKNSVIGERCSVKDVVTKMKRGMLMWFGYVEKINEMECVRIVISGRL